MRIYKLHNFLFLESICYQFCSTWFADTTRKDALQMQQKVFCVLTKHKNRIIALKSPKVDVLKKTSWYP